MWMLTRYIVGDTQMIADPDGDYYECDEVEELLDGLCPPIDPRWRPMRTAPRDGTHIEVQMGNGERIVWWDDTRPGWQNHGDPAGAVGWYRPEDVRRWRACHSDWNEDPK